MKYLLVVIATSLIVNSQAQINPSDARKFGELLEDRRHLYPGVNAGVTEMMHLTYPNHSPLELIADIESLGQSVDVLNNFGYRILLSYSGNREKAGQFFYMMCGNAKMSLEVVDCLLSKFRARLNAEISEKELQRSRERDMTVKTDSSRNEIIDKEKAQQDKKQDVERLAKEKFDIENVPAYYSNNPHEFDRFFSKNFKYSDQPNLQDTGEIVVSFVIKVDGTIDSTRVISSTLSDYFQSELFKVIKLSKWHPALKNGQLTSEKKVIPFKFGSQQ